MLLRLGFGVLAAAAVGLAAWRLRWLRADGAAAAVVVGAAIVGFAGWRGAVPLLLFFITSTLLGRLPGRGAGRRHGARDARQVLANGGPAAVAAVLSAGGDHWAWAALGGALAAANADTWATEIGTRWGGTPRALGFGAALSAGASGGMSLAGTLAGCAGAGLIAATAGGLAAAVGGIAGLLGDSLLGATLQAAYRCPDCGARIETPLHGCPGAGRLEPGRLRWLDNDGVNLAASACGGLLAGLLAVAWR